jgi:secreted trypsin-like serine protease
LVSTVEFSDGEMMGGGMMKHLLALWLGLAAAATLAQDVLPDPAPVPIAEEEDESDGRIVGGDPAPKGTVPWQAELFAAGKAEVQPAELTADRELKPGNPNYKNKKFLDLRDKWEWHHRCGGAIIPTPSGQSGIWILTAAHCVTVLESNPLDWRRVRLGTQDLKSGGRTYAIERVAIHSGYDAARAHDIAIVRVSGTLPATAKPIRLLHDRPNDRALAPRNRLFVTGWGLTAISNAGATLRARDGSLLRGSPVLMQVELQAFPDSQCSAFNSYRAAIASGGALCAGSPTEGKDACPGDSGGPVTRVQGTAPVLVGLVSLGIGCGQKNVPGVYVKVSEYRAWIDKAIREAEPGKAKRIAPPG